MGLCINWTLSAPANASLKTVTASLSGLRAACLDLPFDSVADIEHFESAEIARQLENRDSPARWLLIQASAYCRTNPDDLESAFVSVAPIEVVGFTAYAGEACEPMNCLLARYPEQAPIGRHLVRPGIKGWRGSSFAKTQYASTVSAQHFLKCHLTISAALDAAKALGLLESVTDEGGYWDDRDAQKLLKTVGRWNAMLAAFVGGLELATGENLPAPIKNHPEFERLEHLGTTGDTAAMAKAIAEALKRINPGA